jgi:two-component system, NarL family, sensor kinase
MKYPIIIIIWAASAAHVSGQTSWAQQRDSLLHALSLSKPDSNRAMVLTYLGMQYMYNQQDSAVYYFKEVYQLSAGLHYARGMVNSLTCQAGILSDQNKLDQAISLDSQAILVATTAHYPKALAAIYNNIAIPYNKKGDHAASIGYYLKAATLDEELHDDRNLAMAYANIASAYDDLKEYEKGCAYSLKGIGLARSTQHSSALESGLTNLGSGLIALRRFDTALIVLLELKALGEKLKDYSTVLGASNDLCIIYVEKNQWELVRQTAGKSLSLATSLHDQLSICEAWASLCDYYFAKKDFPTAKTYVSRDIQLAEQEKFNQLLSPAYQKLSTIDILLNDTKGYDHYKVLKDSIDHLLVSDEVLKSTQELETKYLVHEKQNEIDNLSKAQQIQKLTLRQRQTMNWVLGILVLVAVLIGFLLSRNYRQKRALQEQRIAELENEKRLLATEAILQGQVEERSRLARDLHDGLGSILSNAKHSFTHMKDNLIITPENADAFERGMNMLDMSINELRRVAHNMMPEALVKLGLDSALRDFFNSMDGNGAVQMTYQSYDMDESSILKTTAAAVYRIIQELVNNILKHAGATTALIQLIRKNDTLSITVEDNGKGFDPAILQQNEGMGYLNLRNRVTWLNGTLDIETAPGSGTAVHIGLSNITA